MPVSESFVRSLHDVHVQYENDVHEHPDELEDICDIAYQKLIDVVAEALLDTASGSEQEIDAYVDKFYPWFAKQIGEAPTIQAFRFNISQALAMKSRRERAAI